VFVIGAEGIMLLGCFGAIAIPALLGGGWATGILGGIIVSGLAAAAFAAVAVGARVDTIISGIALNFVGSGLTSVLVALVFGAGGVIVASGVGALPSLAVPGLSLVPVLGDVFSGHSPLTYGGLVLAVGVALLLSRTRAGLTIRMTGFDPSVVREAGRSPEWTQVGAIVAGGALLGLAGAQLALAAAAQFSTGMTAGRGFIALAIVLIAGTRTWIALPLVAVFAIFDTLGFTLQNVGLPTELASVLPYLAILLLLAVLGRLPNSGRARAEGPA